MLLVALEVHRYNIYNVYIHVRVCVCMHACVCVLVITYMIVISDGSLGNHANKVLAVKLLFL